jgi:hypothetical protein
LPFILHRNNFNTSQKRGKKGEEEEEDVPGKKVNPKASQE